MHPSYRFSQGHRQPGGTGRREPGQEPVLWSAFRVHEPAPEQSEDSVLGAQWFLSLAKTIGTGKVPLVQGIRRCFDHKQPAVELAFGWSRYFQDGGS